MDKNLLSFIKLLDVIVDGRFVYKLKSDKCKFRGSSNQRLIDVKKTLKNKSVCEYKII
jgi:anaerobic ribonucleoside-triphosphate reductase activating protein